MPRETKRRKEKNTIDLVEFSRQLKSLNVEDIPKLFRHAARFNMPEILVAIFKYAQKLPYEKLLTGESNYLSSILNLPDPKLNITALDYAIDAGHCNIVELLCSLDENLDLQRVSRNHKTSLQNAISGGHREIVAFFYNKGIVLDGATLQQAMLEEKFEIAADIFKLYKVKTNTQQLCEMLSLAAKLKQAKFLESTLSQLKKVSLPWDEKFNSKGKTVLGSAVIHGSLSCVQILIQLAKAKPNVPDKIGKTSLHYAAEQDEMAIAQFLLSNAAKVDDNSYEGKTPLWLAVEKNYIHMVKLLLSFKADLNISVDGKTPLSVALKNESFELSYFLFRKGAFATQHQLVELLCLAISNHKEKHIKEFLEICQSNLDLPCTSKNYTPLMVAARSGNLELVRFFLQNKSNPNYISKSSSENISEITSAAKVGFSPKKMLEKILAISSGPLHQAALCGDVKVAEELINQGAKINAENLLKVTPLQVAASCGHLELVKFLLHSGASIDHKSLSNYTALFWAVTNNHVEVVKFLKSQGANAELGDETYTPLSRALEQGSLEIATCLFDLPLSRKPVQTLINKTTSQFHFPLSQAFVQGFFEMVVGSFRKNEKIKQQNFIELLCLAAKLNKPALIRKLLNSHPRYLMNKSGSEGWTPLNFAVHKGHKNIVLLFLKYNVNVNQLNQKGVDSLHIATLANQYDIAECLISAGARVDRSAANGLTALSMAAYSGLINMVELLLRKGAQINYNAKGYGTPLFIAVVQGHIPIVNLLIQKGADASIKGCIGDKDTGAKGSYIPLILACVNENAKMARALLRNSGRMVEELYKTIDYFSLRDKLTPKFRPIPRNIYLIWVGGAIPKKEYLVNIMQLAALACKNNFNITLVVENILNYHKASALFDINIPNLRILKVSECLNNMSRDPYYHRNSHFLKKFHECILREAVGYKNLAAVADFLRIEILRQTGGHYFDVDTNLTIGTREHLYPQYAEEGLLIHCSNTEMQKDIKGEKELVMATAITNDVMSAVKGHEALSDSLEIMFRNYKKLDNTKWQNRPFHTLQDKKRSLILPNRGAGLTLRVLNKQEVCYYQAGSDDRKSLTLATTGSTILTAAKRYVDKTSSRFAGDDTNCNRAARNTVCLTSIPESILDKDSTAFRENGCLVSGILARHGSDLNWLSNKVQKYAFDDIEIYRSPTRSFLLRK